MNTNKLFDRVRKHKQDLSEAYNVPESAIVYIGNNKYIVVKNGEEIQI